MSTFSILPFTKHLRFPCLPRRIFTRNHLLVFNCEFHTLKATMTKPRRSTTMRFPARQCDSALGDSLQDLHDHESARGATAESEHASVAFIAVGNASMTFFTDHGLALLEKFHMGYCEFILFGQYMVCGFVRLDFSI
jgi:hypothetical protein